MVEFYIMNGFRRLDLLSAVILTVAGIIALAYPARSAQKKSAGTIVYMHAPDESAPWPTIDIYSVEADGSNVKALTTDGRSQSPSWSPDGRHILFIRDTYSSAELWVMDRDGSNPRLLRRVRPWIRSAAWSPDGKVLAATLTRDLFLLSADGHGELKLLLRDAWGPIWSPDGKKLAFAANPAPARWAVHVVNADGSDDVKLTDPSMYPYAGPSAWSPDGKQIAFAALDRDGRMQVFLTDEKGFPPRELITDPNWECHHASWSPNGVQIAVSCNSALARCASGMGGFPAKLGCVRRVFVISSRDPQPKLIQIIDHDGAGATFAPVQ